MVKSGALMYFFLQSFLTEIKCGSLYSEGAKTVWRKNSGCLWIVLFSDSVHSPFIRDYSALADFLGGGGNSLCSAPLITTTVMFIIKACFDDGKKKSPWRDPVTVNRGRSAERELCGNNLTPSLVRLSRRRLPKTNCESVR